MHKPPATANKRTGRVKRQEALADYLATGADRSLKKLWARYCETMVRPPALVTIEKWSARFDWAQKAKDHDERVAERLGEKVEDAVVEQSWNHVKALTDVAKKSLEKVVDALDGDNIKAGDPYQLAALVNSALGAIKGVQLLTGQATNRIDTFASKVHAPQWMIDRLAKVAPAAVPTDDEEAETLH